MDNVTCYFWVWLSIVTVDLQYKRDSFIKNVIDRLIHHGFGSFVCNVIYLISGEGLLHTKKKSLALTHSEIKWVDFISSLYVTIVCSSFPCISQKST